MTPFPFITGCQRSGTTLVRMMLDAHPDMAIPRESQFIPDLARGARRGFDLDRVQRALLAHERFQRWQVPADALHRALHEPTPAVTLADALRRVYALQASLRGKTRYGDKTPRYATSIPLLASLFPEARFVHVIRDGRNVALSLLEVDWGPRSTDRGATYWTRRVRTARAAGRRLGPERYLEVRHEELVADPEAVLRRICDFIDLPFDPVMLRYHEQVGEIEQEHARNLARPPTQNLRDWQTQMRRSDLRVFELLAGDLLTELGYDLATTTDTLKAGERAARARARRVRRWDSFTASAPYRAVREGAVGRAAAAVVRPVTAALTARAAKQARAERAPAPRGGGDG